MDSKQRITAAFKHITPDRTPVFEYVLLSPIADAILGRPYADYGDGTGKWVEVASEIGWERTVRKYVEDRLDLAQRLGHDMLYLIPNPHPDCVNSRPSPPAAHGPVSDPVEAVRRRNSAARQAKPEIADECLMVFRLVRERMAQRGLNLPILAPAYAHGVWTDVDLMQTMVLEPEVAQEHFELATRGSLAWTEAYSELGVTIVGVGGDFAGNRPIISPAAYRDFIVPEVRKVCEAVHKGGMFAVNASDGNLWSVIDDFLIGCEVDGYLEIDVSAGMDLRRLKDAYGNRITFLGNMDCGSVLSFAGPEEIARITVECLEAGAGDGGHIFCASNAITESVPLGNYMAMVNAYRGYFGQSEITT